MKRSVINKAIDDAIALMEERQFPLPPFAYWTPYQWEEAGDAYEEICDNMLGWDVTDFGSGEFSKIGLTVFTFRNGNTHNKEKYPKNYAEKLLLVSDGQVLPYHFHWSKMEDIIHRGGGDLLITLYNSTEDGKFADTDVEVSMDGRKVVIKAGETLLMKPGESITLKPGQYHSWQGVPGTGPVILFEVSTTNDDFVDNRFYEVGERLPQVDEDEPIRHLMFTDYK